MLAKATLSLQPKVHEVVVARAASRQILGPDARVSGRGAAWFASGAAHWADLETDLAPGRLWFDPPAYFSNLDAVAGFPYGSNSGPLSSWYADGTLKLRGFFFGETNDQLHLVYLSARRVPQVVGYGARNGRLYRFQQDPGGDYQVLSGHMALALEQYLFLHPELCSGFTGRRTSAGDDSGASIRHDSLGRDRPGVPRNLENFRNPPIRR
jgi:hypothetical protein